jgi:hypothetical protein
VVSQALFYHHCRPVVERISPELKFDRAGIERLTEHITRFSLAAIKSLARKPRQRKPRQRKPRTGRDSRAGRRVPQE